MKYLQLERYGDVYDVSLDVQEYGSENLAIRLLCLVEDSGESYEEPYANLTVNLRDYECSGNMAFVDTNNLGEDIVEWVQKNGLGKLTGRVGYSGYNSYPEIEFDIQKIKELTQENSINYNELKEIRAKSQEELDLIPLDYKGQIYVEFGERESRAIIKNKYPLDVIVCGKHRAVAQGNSSIIATENSFVKAHDNSSVFAKDKSFVSAKDNSNVIANIRPKKGAVNKYGLASFHRTNVNAFDNATVHAIGDTMVTAVNNAKVYACDRSLVRAMGNVKVYATGNSFISAMRDASVTASDNSVISALHSVRVNAFDNATVSLLGRNVTLTADKTVKIIDKREVMEKESLVFKEAEARFIQVEKNYPNDSTMSDLKKEQDQKITMKNLVNEKNQEFKTSQQNKLQSTPNNETKPLPTPKRSNIEAR